MTEVRVPRARGEDQIVVRQLASAVEYGDAPLRIDSLDLCHQDLGVFLLTKQPPKRRGDVRRSERGRRDLIEQRLKRVMIGAIDERDFGERVTKLARGVEPAEAATDDEHPWSFHGEPPIKCAPRVLRRAARLT